MNPPAYAELDATTNFSFLRGASHPHELAETAKTLGLAALGVVDRNTLAGVVRAHVAAKTAGLKLVVGARLDLEDAPSLLAYPEDRAAYGRLSRLITRGKLRAPKGACRLTFADVVDHAEGLRFIIVPPAEPAPSTGFAAFAARAAGLWPGRVDLGADAPRAGDDRERLGRLDALARDAGVGLIAIGGVLHHAPERKPLADVLACLREKTTVAQAGRRLEPNADRHLKSPAEMARRFKGFEHALARTLLVADACRFSLDDLRYEYPDEPTPPGTTAQSRLADLTWRGAAWRYPDGVPERVRVSLEHELALIETLGYAPYFLTVHDVVAWARAQGILCQGRGSAANSAVCFCLAITAVDPAKIDLLFERFVSRERKEPPDIDVDFEHERREEVIQYIYARYGRMRAGLAATVISYRPRLAAREVCKALGLSADVGGALAGAVWGAWGQGLSEDQIRQAGLDPETPLVRQAADLVRALVGFPRHLSQHVGGFVLTRGPLAETVPIGPAAMPDRSFIEWDKDDIDALGILKVDVLGLGMLTCIRKAFDLIADHHGRRLCLASVPAEDPAVYDMLCAADSLGVFQVESRAQMNMLPRLRPRTFYDLVIEVAIVRPGPIQGDMVHPYLRRRQGLERVAFPSPDPAHGPADELERVLGRTLGVPLFQEQAMRIAIEAAKFTPDEANALRRAMATFRKVGTIHTFQEKMIDGMATRGYERAFAERCFKQIEGFGEYGFPESHAASFALLVYVSSWIKKHYPDVFCAALLNSQPMGFYAPAQIVRDARAHGVEVRAVDVNHSDWDTTLEPGPASTGPCAVRLGFRQVDGLGEAAAWAIVAGRGRGYSDLETVRRRSGAPRAALERLAAADAFGSLGLNRRDAEWSARGQTASPALPLFLSAEAAETGPEPAASLPAMSDSEAVVRDYESLRLSLKAHPLAFLREAYAAKGRITTAAAAARPDGALVRTAGVVLVRQRPGSAKGVVFITIEDETGVANLVVWPKTTEAYRKVVMGARLLAVRGRVQASPEGVVHIVASTLEDRSEDLLALSEDAFAPPLARADEVARPGPDPVFWRHPRDARILPKSRDFH